MNAIPKSKEEARKRIIQLSKEYLEKRGTPRGSAIEKEIFALKAWLVAQR